MLTLSIYLLIRSEAAYIFLFEVFSLTFNVSLLILVVSYTCVVTKRFHDIGLSFIAGFLINNAFIWGSFWVYNEYFPNPEPDFVRYIDNAYLNSQILDFIWFIKYAIFSQIVYCGLMYAIPSQQTSNRFDISWNEKLMAERLKWFEVAQKNRLFRKA